MTNLIGGDGRLIGSGVLEPQTVNAGRHGRYSLANFRQIGDFTASAGGTTPYGAPTGATGDTNYWNIPCDVGGICQTEYHVKGAGSTILSPRVDVTNSLGVIITQDLTSTEGAEFLFGVTNGSTRGKHTYTIGTDAPFFAKLTIYLTDASGAGDLLFGFRKSQAYQTAHTAYTDYATIAITGTANPNPIQTKIRLASGTATAVATGLTFADTTARTFYVVVYQDGSVRFAVDGALLDSSTTTRIGQSFSFAIGTVVVPYLWFINTADVAELTILQQLEIGYLKKRSY